MESYPKPPLPPPVTGYPAAAQPAYPATHGGPSYPYGYAHPYPAPPQNNSANAAGAGLRRRRFLVAALAVAGAIGVIWLLAWIILRPRIPVFSVSAASVSSFNVTAPFLSASFDLTVTARNPNQKLSIYYDSVVVGVGYGSGDTIADSTLPPFQQPKGNVADLHATLVAAATYVGNDEAGKISAERSRDGAVGFNVRMLAWVHFRTGIFPSRRHTMRVFCDGVKIGFPNATANAGSLTGPQPRSCEVVL